MKKPKICEISAPFRSFQHPCRFVLLPKSHRLHCFQKSISSLAEAANKRRTAGKLGYNAIDTFSTKKEELAIVIYSPVYLCLAEFVIINLGPHQRRWLADMLLLCLCSFHRRMQNHKIHMLSHSCKCCVCETFVYM